MTAGGRRRSAVVLALPAGALLAVASCTGGHPAPPAPTAVPVVTTAPPTTFIDYSSVSLAPIAGQTTLPPVSVTPGRAGLNGTVTDDTGAPVAGATVLLQRVVGSQVGQANVTSNGAGAWVAQGISGGLYRVRAWRAPDLAENTGQVLFLGAAGATQTVNLTVNHYTGLSAGSSVAPSPPIIGEPANIVVQIAGVTVGTDGVVRSQGQPGLTVVLVGNGAWAIDGSTTETSDSGGYASWQGTCDALGDQPLEVLVGGTQTFPLNIPPCVPVPPTTTSTSSTSTSSTVPTHTTQPKHRTTTTTIG